MKLKRKPVLLELYNFTWYLFVKRLCLHSHIFAFLFCFIVSSYSCGCGAEWNKKENDRVGM